ncbi:MAG: hypothetical protein ABI919_00680 [Ramlibacter sp.]
MFAAQVPAFGDFLGRAATFGNHATAVDQVPRGGDLMVRYPDGTLRNLTKEAGFGMQGFQGLNAIAVREPSIHWSGTKALFSMLVGSPTDFGGPAAGPFFWQLYEVSNFGQGQTAVISKVANQPANVNNVSPLYAASDDRILFTSDRPHNGLTHLYPPLDEYESSPTVSGIWSLNPAVAGGDVHILNHTPSGAFTPIIDSAGRVVFTRWDHLQRDQQRDGGGFGAKNFTSETAGAASANVDQNPGSEVFPEPRSPSTSPYGPVRAHFFNAFSPWQMNDDGTDEETLNHVGRHELNFGFLEKTFAADPDLQEDNSGDTAGRANRKQVNTDGGLFHLREDPATPGTYLGIMAREFGSLATNQIVRLTGGSNLNGDQMVVTDVTVGGLNANGSPGGRYRNPLPLTSGKLVATYTSSPTANADTNRATMKDFRLKLLNPSGPGGLFEGAAATPLTNGIVKNVTWFNPNNGSDPNAHHEGALWEMEAVEVVARQRPARAGPQLEAPEASVFTQQQVDPAAFRNWLVTNNLALIVSRNVTSRDDADRQQPFNLRVPGGVESISTSRPGARKYDVAALQIFQADQIRGYDRAGRRSIAQPLHGLPVTNPNPGTVISSVNVGADGSTAAFVPARRALTWQLTDQQGAPVVRERMWLTMQPGEVRVCASCHGANVKDQAGRTAIVNEPDALRQLLAAWKAMPGATQAAQAAQSARAIRTGTVAPLLQRALEEKKR